MICPLMSLQKSYAGLSECVEDRCAWWIITGKDDLHVPTGKCALKLLAEGSI